MWGRPPFTITENCAIDVRDLAASRQWYMQKLGLRESHARESDDSGRPFADLFAFSDEACISLVELPSGAPPEKRHVIFFAKKPENAREWIMQRGISVEPIIQDSGGNRFFRFRDLEGNFIEVCLEPGS